MKINAKIFLRVSFILGAILDGIIAINWILIVLGVNIPSIASGHIGKGFDYQRAMFINTLFMVGWSILLFWCAFEPEKRREIILLTAILLFLSIIGDLIFYQNILSGLGFILGTGKRILLVVIFFSSYLYSVCTGKK